MTIDLRAFTEKLDKRRDALRALLPSDIPVERFVKNLITAVSSTPQLLDCTEASLVEAAYKLANAGLEPGSLTGECFITTRNKRVGDKQWVKVAEPTPTYKGLIKSLVRSGAVKAVHSGAVFENDTFDFELGDTPYIKHKPTLKARGDIIASYCIIDLANGSKAYELMTSEDLASVENAAAESRKGNAGVWATAWKSEMARKAVVKRAIKSISGVSPQVSHTIDLDNQQFDISTAHLPQGSNTLKDRLLQQTKEYEDTPEPPSLEQYDNGE